MLSCPMATENSGSGLRCFSYWNSW